MNQKPNIIDKLDLALMDHNRRLELAQKELSNENLTNGETIAVHIEIEQLKFALKTLNFIKND
jgi:hypothetical protein